MRPALLIINPLLIANYLQNIVVNLHQDFVPACASTSFKDRWIGAHSNGPTTPEKLFCPNKKKKKKC
jgi:hypothetical protein